MKKILSLTIIAVLASGAAQATPTTVFLDDFDTYRVPGETSDTVLVVKHFLPKIWYAGVDPVVTSVVDHPLSWYAGTEWGTLLGATNGTPSANEAPADSSAGAALRVGVWQDWGEREAFVSPSSNLTYNVNTNYTVSFRAMLKDKTVFGVGDPTANAAATGTVGVAVGYMNTNSVFVSLGGENVELSAVNWTESSATASGGTLTGSRAAALGQTIVIRFQREWETGSNTENYQSWVDWVQVDAFDPWIEHVGDAGLDSSDRTADDDLDGVDNFTEWAIGGDPKDSNDTGYASRIAIVDQNDNGTNQVAQIFPRMTAYRRNGIEYTFQTTDNLVFPDWADQSPEEGSDDLLWDDQFVNTDGFGSGYDAVSNIYVSSMLTSNEVHFFKLNIGHPSYNP